MILRLALLAVLIGVSGCNTMKPEDFAGREPKLLIEEYFAGRTKAWGIFQDRFGQLRRQFEVEIEGTWDGKTLTLVEDFLYDDGETERRVWRIAKGGEHEYEGRAEGVIGVAEGLAYGNALNWSYRFALKVGDSTWNVTFDDWLFLQSDGVLINRAEVTKFGVKLGEVTLVFRKLAAAPVRAAAE
ncbi:MAG: DUF3833 domain-containing protein [Rhodospirillales bacterium]|nr:DUF3833 domain-containing protein [Rhodospirillales bacterium]